MTAHESTNAHGDAHAAALLRSRKRAALAAWQSAVETWERGAVSYYTVYLPAWRLAAERIGLMSAATPNDVAFGGDR